MSVLLLAALSSSTSPIICRLLCRSDGLDTFTKILSLHYHVIFTSLITPAISLQADRPKQRVKKRKLVFLHSSPDYCRCSVASFSSIISIFPVIYVCISTQSPQYFMSSISVFSVQNEHHCWLQRCRWPDL